MLFVPNLTENAKSYLYAYDYHVGTNGELPIIAHARMYAIAEKYNIPPLKELAQEKFAATLWDVNNAKDFDIPAFVAAIDIIFSSTLSTDRGLRDTILPTMVHFKAELRNSNDFMGLITAGLGNLNFAVEVTDAWANMGTMLDRDWAAMLALQEDRVFGKHTAPVAILL